MALILASRRQRQADLYEFEASLIYRASSRTDFKATQRNSVLKQQTDNNNNNNKKAQPRSWV